MNHNFIPDLGVKWNFWKEIETKLIINVPKGFLRFLKVFNVLQSMKRYALKIFQVLKVRQHPKKGFYADGLITVPVKDYADIERRIEQGTKNRTIASTNMNASSSRAHTIVGVTFIQKVEFCYTLFLTRNWLKDSARLKNERALFQNLGNFTIQEYSNSLRMKRENF